jgi:transposase InsO family protein
VDRYVQLRKVVFVGIEEWEDSPMGRVVPEKSVKEVVLAIHEGLGHAGARPTRRELEIHNLCIKEKRVREVIQECVNCGQYNAGRRGQRSEGLTIESTVPWGSVCMDVAGPMGITGKKGEKYLIVLVDSMSGYVTTRAVRSANGNSVVTMLTQVCSDLGVPKELRTDNGSHFRNDQVDQWCQQHSVARIYSPPHTPQANAVVKRTIGLVKLWIGKNENTKDWSTRLVEIGRSLNDRHRQDRTAPSQELNQRPYATTEVGRSQDLKRVGSERKGPFQVGQRVWVKARDHPSGTAVKPKYEIQDIVKQIIDQNTVLLKKKGVQGVSQLKATKY